LILPCARRTIRNASAKLALACVQGTHIKTVTITFGKVNGGKLVKGVMYTLTGVLITSEQLGSAKGDPKPTESLSLNYSKIEVKYHS
jgi:type VI protein secretion system component Hcp